MLTEPNKAALRRRFLQERTHITPEKQAERDNEILYRLLTMAEYRHASAVYTYVSRKDEVSTRILIQAAWANGKTVAVPRWQADGTMTFYRIRSWDDLKPGRFGIEEPVDSCPPAPMPDKSALCIVPGLAFDVEGYRLGYGKGCYDRYLPVFPGLTIGLCPASAAVLALPREESDCPVQLIITEQYIRKP